MGQPLLFESGLTGLTNRADCPTPQRQQLPGISAPPNLLSIGLLVSLTVLQGATFQAPKDNSDKRRQVVATQQHNLLESTLAPSAQAPFKNQTASAPVLLRTLVDTSASTFQSLLVQAPFKPVDFSSVQWPKWTNPDTSRGTPKPLYADSVQPFTNQPPALVGPLRNVVDTSQSTFEALLQPTQAPFSNQTLPAPQLMRNVVDTTQYTSLTLLDSGVKPFFNSPQLLADRIRPVADTSQSSPAPLLVPPVAPVFNPPSFLIDQIRPVYDTSKGTPLTLIDSGVKPFFNPPQFLADPQRPVTDTSKESNLKLLTAIVAPPFKQTDWPSPIEYRSQFQLHTWDQPTNPEFIPAFVPPVVVPDVTGGWPIYYGRKIRHDREQARLRQIEDETRAIERQIALAKTEKGKIKARAKLESNRQKEAQQAKLLELLIIELQTELQAIQDKEDEDFIAWLLLNI